jgi:molecular chaperone GrpE (heat shock protein)
MKQIKCDVCGNEILVERAPAEEAVVPEIPDTQGILSEILLNTQEQCAMVDGLIRNQINLKDAQIDKLHSELQYYKDDQASKFINQVMKAVIKVRKDMLKRTTSRSWDEMSAAELKREYEYVVDDLTDLLEQQNIDPYETAPGEPFDASRHQVFKLEPTDDASLDKTIQKSVSEGYTKNGKVLIVERVIVYQHKVK